MFRFIAAISWFIQSKTFMNKIEIKKMIRRIHVSPRRLKITSNPDINAKNKFAKLHPLTFCSWLNCEVSRRAPQKWLVINFQSLMALLSAPGSWLKQKLHFPPQSLESYPTEWHFEPHQRYNWLILGPERHRKKTSSPKNAWSVLMGLNVEILFVALFSEW